MKFTQRLVGVCAVVPLLAFSTSLLGATRLLVKFVEVKGYEIDGSQLPPALSVKYDLRCNQSLLKVVREDLPESDQKANVNVGVLVVEDTTLDCDRNTTSEAESGAGTVFSGREYEISLIEADTP